MPQLITFKCRNCGLTIRYSKRNGQKPAKLCNDCDKKGANNKRDMDSYTRKVARYTNLY